MKFLRSGLNTFPRLVMLLIAHALELSEHVARILQWLLALLSAVPHITMTPRVLANRVAILE